MRRIFKSSYLCIPLIVLGASVVILTGCAKKEMPLTEKNKAVVVRAWEEIINQGKLDVADEVFATDYVIHNAGNPDVQGIEEGVIKPISRQLARFPDMHCTVEDLIAEGDLVASRFTFTGTHQGEFMGIQPTDKKVTTTGIVISHLAEGKIVEDWANEDDLGLMQQLGAAPARELGDYTWGKPASEISGAPGSPEENKAIYIRELEMWNEKKMEIAEEIFSPELVNHDPVWPEVTNLESYKKWVSDWLKSAPDMNITADVIIAEGDKVACRWTCRWTDTAGIADNPPTEKQITVTGIDICRFADGKIVERWWSKDILGVMKQVGLIPSPEQDEKQPS